MDIWGTTAWTGQPVQFGLTGLPGQVSLGRTDGTINRQRSAWMDQFVKVSQDSSAGKYKPGRSAWTSRPRQVSLDRSFWMDEPRQDKGGKPEGTSHPGHISQDSSTWTIDRLAWTGKLGWVSLGQGRLGQLSLGQGRLGQLSLDGTDGTSQEEQVSLNRAAWAGQP
jgi:hypothetical protein